MTNKVQKIREEVVGIINSINLFTPDEDGKNSSYEAGKLDVASKILQVIDYLQEETVSVWHDKNEEPDEDRQVLINLSGFCYVDFYHKEDKRFYMFGKPKHYLCEVDKWAYIDDLLNLSKVQRTVKEWSEEDDRMLGVLGIAIQKTFGKESRSVSEWVRNLKNRCVPQKKEWSEEDEELFEEIKRCVGIQYPLGNPCIFKFLKSLKDRVGFEVNCITTKEWSEDDEKNLRVVVYYLIADNGLTLKHINWLKSLKNRVQPQKQEWGEEDKQYLLVCKNALYKYQSSDQWDAGIIIRWLENKLKSFRPQSAWKPSEEQMEALEKECFAHSNYDLCRLLEDLKKL